MGRPSLRRNTQNRSPELPLFHENVCVDALRALAEDTRMRIVSLLLDEPLGVNEIARRLSATHYNISKHLRILRQAGIVDVETRGREHLYCVPESMRKDPGTRSRVLDLGCCSFQFERRS